MNGRDAGHGVGIVSDGGHQVSDDGSCRGRGVDGGSISATASGVTRIASRMGGGSGNPLESERQDKGRELDGMYKVRSE